MHIYLTTRKGARTVDANLTGSFRSDWHSNELDLGKQGWGEIEYAVKISYQFTVDLAAIKKSGADWWDDGVDANTGPKSKNPPWDAIERAITRIIQSSEFKSRLMEDVSEKLG